jgi:hypothetical protein
MCRDRSMKAPVTWHARSQARGKAASRDDCARKLKCCSPISNAFSSSIGSDYEGRMVRVMSSFSQVAAQNLRKLAKLIPMPSTHPA